MCGIPIEKGKEIRKIIGYLPQEFSMYPSMKVGEAMEYLAILSGLSGSERKERINALLNNPKVLIVDEPTAGLDPEERVRFRNLLSEIAEDKIVILSTHIVGDIEATCEDIAIINEGNKVHIRFIADTLMQGAKACEPNMEDAYMLYLHTSGVGEILDEIGGEW